MVGIGILSAISRKWARFGATPGKGLSLAPNSKVSECTLETMFTPFPPHYKRIYKEFIEGFAKGFAKGFVQGLTEAFAKGFTKRF